VSRRHSKILVTGGAGFIGSHIVDRLLEIGFDVTVIDDLSYGRNDNIIHNQGNRSFHFIKGDIRDQSLLKRTIKDIDAIFHQAALVNVALAVVNPELANSINITGSLNLLKASIDQGVKRFVYASTAAVYGDNMNSKSSETDSTNPISPYGISKLAAEQYANYFYRTYGLDTVSLRYFNVYGPRQNLDAQSPYSGVISTFFNTLLNNNPLVIHGDGEQTRDFVFVEDIIEANILALDSRSGVGKSFNIGTGTSYSINYLAETLKHLLNRKNLKNVYCEPRLGDIRHSCADISKASSILGYKPKVSLEEGLKRFVNWHQSGKCAFK